MAARKREKVAWFAAGWRVCVTAIWCPRHPRKFLIKFSPLPGARPDRGVRAGTPSEFFSSVSVEQRPTSQSSPHSIPFPSRTWQLQIAFAPLEAKSFHRKVSFILICHRRASEIIKLDHRRWSWIYLDFPIPFSFLALFKVGAGSFPRNVARLTSFTPGICLTLYCFALFWAKQLNKYEKARDILENV